MQIQINVWTEVVVFCLCFVVVVEKSPFNKVHWVTDPFVESVFH